MATNNAQCKGNGGILWKASQEQGRLPVRCVRPMSPSAGPGEEEVSGWSASVEELMLQPLRSSYIPAEGSGGLGRTLGWVWAGSLSVRFKWLGPLWKVLEESEYVLSSSTFWNFLRVIKNDSW